MVAKTTALGSPGLALLERPEKITEAEAFEEWQDAALAWAQLVYKKGTKPKLVATLEGFELDAWDRLEETRGTPPYGISLEEIMSSVAEETGEGED